MKIDAAAVKKYQQAAQLLPKTQAEKQPLNALLQVRTDKAEFSDAGRRAADEAQLEMLKNQLKSGQAEAESTADSFEKKRKCMMIALRVLNGDTVPQKDLRYLQEHEPEMYQQAIMMRRTNDDPKRYKRLSEDEEAQAQGGEVSAPSGDRTAEAVAAVEAAVSPSAEGASAPETSV